MNHDVNISWTIVTGLLVPAEAAADRIIAPYRDVLRTSITESFADWTRVLQTSPIQTAGLTSYVQRRFIHDRIIHRLATAQASGDHPGLRITTINGLRVAVLSDKILLKFKRLNLKLRSRNIPTGQTLRFDNQGSLLLECLDSTNATAGYVLTGSGAVPVQLVVVCRDGDDHVWTIDLADQAHTTSEPIAEIQAQTMPPRRRVKVVAEAADVAAANDGD